VGGAANSTSPTDARRTAVAGTRPPPDELADKCDVDPVSVARTICLRLLTVRARTRTELAAELRRRNVPDEAAHTMLERLAAVRLIDDASFAEDFVTSRVTERGLAGRELRRQLKEKGVADDIVEAATANVDADTERATAGRLVERKLRSMTSLDPTVQTRRLLGLLARKGYSSALSYAVVREAVIAAGGALDTAALDDTASGLA
jgi:regulatory protein